jgi:hypothetical protein
VPSRLTSSTLVEIGSHGVDEPARVIESCLGVVG